MIYKVMKNRKIMKELKIIQILGIIVSYTIVILVASVIIIYPGNWIAGFSPNNIGRVFIQVIIICITLYISRSLLKIALLQITNGVVPKNSD